MMSTSPNIANEQMIQCHFVLRDQVAVNYGQQYDAFLVSIEQFFYFSFSSLTKATNTWLWSLSEGVGEPVVESRVTRSSANSGRGAPNVNSPSPGRKRVQAQRGEADPGLERRVLDPRNRRRKRAMPTEKQGSPIERSENHGNNEL